MSFAEYFEFCLGSLFKYVYGHDHGLLSKSVALSKQSTPRITVKAPECGASGSNLKLEHSQWARDGSTGRFPDLTWEVPADLGRAVAEYVLVCEDPDVPIPQFCAMHSTFYAIPGTTTTARHTDIEIADKAASTTRAGWRYVPNMYGSSYMGPRPPLGHRPHRYFYTVVALSEPLGLGKEPGSKVTRAAARKAMEGKVLAWGEWIGNFEHTWGMGY